MVLYFLGMAMLSKRLSWTVFPSNILRTYVDGSSEIQTLCHLTLVL